MGTAARTGPAKRKRLRSRADLMLEIALLAAGLAVLSPFVYMIVCSFRSEARLFDVFNIPDFTYWDNYKEVLRGGGYFRSLLNSAAITSATLALTAILSSMAGFAIVRTGGRLLGAVFLILLSGMIIPLQTSIVPLYRLGSALRLMDTRTFQILLHTAGSIPLATFLYAVMTRAVSREYDEAALIDGCGRPALYWRVIFPLLLPATATVVVTTAFGIWNDMTAPLLFLYDERKMTVAGMIYHFKGEKTTEWAPVFALCTLASLPPLALFAAVQKTFFRYFAGDGLKG